MPECDKKSPIEGAEEESFYRLTFYEVLGVSEGATADDIKRAYKRGILENHPDKNTSLDATVATKRFRRIQEAYEVLADPQARQVPNRFPNHNHPLPSKDDNTISNETHKDTDTSQLRLPLMQHHPHHAHIHTTIITSIPPTTSPMHSFSFMFNSSSQASFSFGFSSSTTAQNGEDDDEEVVWSFTTRSGDHDNEHHHPAPPARHEASSRKYSTPSSEGESISEDEDDGSSSD